MIDGIKIKSLRVFNDDPDRDEDKDRGGFLMEVLRSDDNILKKFGQTTFTVANPGTIKAFHYHEKQDDHWFVATGRAKIVLHDLRENSSTRGETQVLFAGKDDYKLISIPFGVAHGYQVVSPEPVLLFYHTTEPYDSDRPDERRLAWNDPSIGFDWTKEMLG